MSLPMRGQQHEACSEYYSPAEQSRALPGLPLRVPPRGGCPSAFRQKPLPSADSPEEPHQSAQEMSGAGRCHLRPTPRTVFTMAKVSGAQAHTARAAGHLTTPYQLLPASKDAWNGAGWGPPRRLGAAHYSQNQKTGDAVLLNWPEAELSGD